MLDFNRAIELDTNYVYAYHKRGVIYGLKGDYKYALNDLNKALKLSFSNGDIYIDRGYIKYLTKDYDGALKDYEKCIYYLDTQPEQKTYNRYKLYYYMGLVCEIKGDNKSAIDNYNTSLRYKKYEEAYNARGLLSMKMESGKLELALLDFDRAIALNPNYAEAYYNRATAKKIAGDKTACDDFKAAFKLGYTKAASFIQKDCKGL